METLVRNDVTIDVPLTRLDYPDRNITDWAEIERIIKSAFIRAAWRPIYLGGTLKRPLCRPIDKLRPVDEMTETKILKTS